MSDPGMASELGGIGTLLRLPAEVRKKIYCYLLSTEYTNYTADPEDDASLTVLRDCTTLWPRYSYDYSVNILFTSKAIYNEASAVLYEGNSIVSISTRIPGDLESLCTAVGIPLRRYLGPRRETHLHCTMWLDYHMNIMNRGRRFIMETPLYYRIAGDDIGPLCEGLLLTDMALGMQDLQHTTLRIKLYEHYGASIDFRTESPHRRLLHHFTRLHSIESFELESPGTERHEYIQQVIDSATADPPSIDAVLADIMATKREAKLLSRSENHAKAVEKYQQALKELLFNNSRFEHNKSPSKGKNTGQSYAAIANRLNFKFHCKLVDLHFILHKGDDVYCWAARASGPLFHYSDPDLEIDNLRARLRVLKTRAEYEMNERR